MSGLGIVRASDFARKMFSGFQFGQGSEMKGRFTMNVKKILAALAVTGCALQGFSSVESANVVGYNSYQCPEDENGYFIGSFDNIGEAGKIQLGQIKPDENWDCTFCDTIATLNNLGLQEQYYTYDSGDWYVCDAFGNTEGDPINDTELDLNVGLIVYSYWGSQLTFSGAVAQGDCELNTEEDANAYTGNFTPAPLKIGDIVPDGDWDCTFCDTLAVLNSLGLQEVYYTYDSGDWYVCDAFGNTEGDPVNETVSFDPNSVFLIYTYWGSKVSFPSPLK